VFSEFHNRRQFEKNFNATFVSLIPKKTCVVDVKDFQPSSLVGRVYKIISKVLANMFKSILGKIISNSQNAFIGG
jgi:ribosomal protein S17